MSLTQINKAGLDELALDHVFTIGAYGTDHYTFQGEGLNGTVNDPTLYLTRGKTYRFENGTGAHPIRIQSTSGASGTAYNTGVTNNAGSGTVIVEVQHDAPDVLYYQCTSHANMNGVLYITGALADGGVTTAKLADDAVTDAKLANSINTAIAANTAKNTNATHTGDVTGSGSLTIASNAVTTAKIADEAVTLAKLEHGTGSNDGKFLRANNGADPSFETITGTTINNNADNKVITGSGTANTLEGEANLIFDGSNLGIGTNNPSGESINGSQNLVIMDTSSDGGMNIKTGTSANAQIHFSDTSANGQGRLIYNHADDSMRYHTSGSERMRIDSSGKVGINESSNINGRLHVQHDALNENILHATRYNQQSTDKPIFAVTEAQMTNFPDSGTIIGNHNRDIFIGPIFLDTGVVNTSDTTGLCLRSSGRVGIGTTSPADKFHVVAGSQRNFVVRSTGGEPHLYAQNDSGNVENLMIGGNNVIFKAGSGSTGSEIARISENGGITFNGDTAAANALDDYEEGTWTPSYRYGANVTLTGNTNGEYVRIGNLVYIRGYIQNSYVAGGQSWDADIAGLPFTPNSGSYGIYPISAYGTAWSYNTGYYGIIGNVNESHASIFLRASNSQGHGAAPTAYNMTNTTSTYIAGCYHTLGF